MISIRSSLQKEASSLLLVPLCLSHFPWSSLCLSNSSLWVAPALLSSHNKESSQQTVQAEAQGRASWESPVDWGPPQRTTVKGLGMWSFLPAHKQQSLALPRLPRFSRYTELWDFHTLVHSRFGEAVTESYFIWELGTKKFCLHIFRRGKKKVSFINIHWVVWRDGADEQDRLHSSDAYTRVSVSKEPRFPQAFLTQYGCQSLSGAWVHLSARPVCSPLAE